MVSIVYIAWLKLNCSLISSSLLEIRANTGGIWLEYGNVQGNGIFKKPTIASLYTHFVGFLRSLHGFEFYTETFDNLKWIKNCMYLLIAFKKHKLLSVDYYSLYRKVF
jgi:hypothetical protein